MRKRWLILAGVAGFLSAAAVWFWPTAPLWRSACAEDGVILRFGPDDRTLYTAEGISTGSPLNPRLSRWDAATGDLLGNVELPLPEPTGQLSVRLSPDAGTVLLGVMMPRNGGHSWVCFLYDAATGRRRGGPLIDVQHINPATFSRDSRWFWVFFGSAAKPWDGIDVIESATGKRILELRSQGDEKPQDACFAPDGSAIAVHCRKGAKGAERDLVRIIDLPNGQERRSFDLPSRTWQRVDEWVGQRLYAEINVPNGPPGHYFRRSYSFDLSAADIGDGIKEPLLSGHVNGTDGQTYWEDGPGWLAYVNLSSREVNKWEQWLEWLAPKVGFKYSARRGLHETVRFVDPRTGGLRYEVPALFRYGCSIASDGQRLACVREGGIVEVWDANPPLRWPWAIAAGIAAAFPILLLGRWRSRRLVHSVV